MSADAEVARLIADRYEIIRPLASGSMGTVYIARHTVTESQVALKLLHNETRRDPASIERFLREVRVGARIGHDGVVKVHDAGVDPVDGTPYIAMELLDGESLFDRLQRADVTQDQALSLMVQILEPLALAHQKGIIHRDLKPENIFIARRFDGSEQVKILDFGIARDMGSKSATATGIAVGTPYYMSPEQATRPREVGPASDVWAMGVMLYELMCSAVPFDGESVHAVILAACTLPHRPPGQLAPEMDARLVAVIDKCLAKDHKERYPNAGELLAALRTTLGDARLRSSLSMRTVRPSMVPGTGSRVGSLAGSGTRNVPVGLAGTMASSSAQRPAALIPASGRTGQDPIAIQDPAAPGGRPSAPWASSGGAGLAALVAAPGQAASTGPMPAYGSPAASAPVPVMGSAVAPPVVGAPVPAVPRERSSRTPLVLGVLFGVLGLGGGAAALIATGVIGGGTSEATTVTPLAPRPEAMPTAPVPPVQPAPEQVEGFGTTTATPAPVVAPTAVEEETAAAEGAPAKRRPGRRTSSATETATATATEPATATATEPATATATATEPATATRPATTTAPATTATTRPATTTTTTTVRPGTASTTTTTAVRPGTRPATGTTTTRPGTGTRPTKRRPDPPAITF